MNRREMQRNSMRLPLLRMGCRAAIIIAAAIMLRQSANADTYRVLPAPIPVVLSVGERAVSANIEVARSYVPQRIYIQLALLGAPTFFTPAPIARQWLVKPGVEDAPMPALTPLEAVNSADLDAVRAILEAKGIRRSDISARLTHAPGGEQIGEVRINVDPANASQFDAVAREVDAAIAGHRNIAGSGTIVQMSSCDAETETSTAAMRAATDMASLLARSAGLSLSTVRQSDLRWTANTSRYQTVCGAKEASPPVYDWGVPATGTLSGYPVSVEGGAVFHAQPNGTAAVMHEHFLDSSTAGDNHLTLVSHQFIVPDTEPFVSAQGRFNAVVKPDTLVATVDIPVFTSRAIPPHLIDGLAGAMRDAGVAPGAMLRGSSRLVARLSSDNQMADLQARISAVAHQNGDYPVYSWTVPFLAHCDSIREAVAAAAYHQALARAHIMAAEAHLKVGPVIAVNDAGFHDGTMCGYGKDTPLRILAKVIESPDILDQVENNSTFSSNIVVAWRLSGADAARRVLSPPQFAPPYAESTMYEAFMTNGESVVGDAKRAVQPTQAFLSLPPQQQITPSLALYFKDLWWEESNAVIDRAGELRVSDPVQVKSVLVKLHDSGITLNNLQFRSASCDRVEAHALREATDAALTRSSGHPLQALIDQGAIYRPNFSICGLRNSIGSSGAYIGGPFSDYSVGESSIEERVLAVTGT